MGRTPRSRRWFSDIRTHLLFRGAGDRIITSFSFRGTSNDKPKKPKIKAGFGLGQRHPEWKRVRSLFSWGARIWYQDGSGISFLFPLNGSYIWYVNKTIKNKKQNTWKIYFYFLQSSLFFYPPFHLVQEWVIRMGVVQWDVLLGIQKNSRQTLNL